ncbi:Phosphoglycolate phosphatase [Sinobacterium norvegicum]|uniref:Phosphoglycolate phosphatase n=1 Tax=Sinobacterium norvegicum TaxID=1641715 RepID=A0ABN8EGA9_9GAMM|nr:phosphoglycolate phosphatase [Sinobacterium norvegicum]CAH0991473.1 Phosphoglycolate phosphatase [Sinobacterium norvegicum]
MQVTKPQAVLFDLDGTLVDSVPDIALALDAALAELSLAEAGIDRVRDWVGNGARILVVRGLAWGLQQTTESLSTEQIDRAEQLFRQHYSRYLNQASALYSGVTEYLSWLHAQAVPMAVVTNKPIAFVPALLSGLGIDGFFDVVLGGDSVDNSKPHPQMLLVACQRLGVEPQQCWMVGDSCNDIEAARAAEMPVVGVSYGYNHGRDIALDRPDRVVDSLNELIM